MSAVPGPSWNPTLRGEREVQRDLPMRARALVFDDLRAAGWTITEGIGGAATVKAPSPATNRDEGISRRRAALARARHAQLREDAVRSFISRMERIRLHRGRFTSIRDLMADGSALADRLASAGHEPQNLSEAIQPEIIPIEPGACCPHTGLLLTDIWRYFRHTWATPYKAAPGRSLAVLVRDAAAPFHPVIGIGLLASAPAQIRVRDAWIGWSGAQVLAACAADPSPARCAQLHSALRQNFEEVYIDDLIADQTLLPRALQAPQPSDIDTLRAAAATAMAAHRRFADGRRDPPRPAEEIDWQARATTPLFRAKRCLLLASLLSARRVLGSLTPARLADLSTTNAGRQALLTLARREKARRMGQAIAELTVCGAISPYRELLGGKLISMLMVGPTVRRAWEARYAEAASEIASAVAGRPLRREARLGAIFTTSLYGRGAQYNRIALPPLRPDRAGPRYAFIGNTTGFGTTHISPQTAAALSQLVAVARGGERLHSLFGEGVSPRLRRLREGLDRLGLPSEQLLQHGEARAVYAIALGDRATAWLRGEADDPQLYDEGIDPVIGDAALVDHWRQRWLRPRLARPDALAPLRAHRLTLPLRHGARVVLPPLDDEG